MVKSRSLRTARPISASRTGAADQVQLVPGRGERGAERPRRLRARGSGRRAKSRQPSVPTADPGSGYHRAMATGGARASHDAGGQQHPRSRRRGGAAGATRRAPSVPARAAVGPSAAAAGRDGGCARSTSSAPAASSSTWPATIPRGALIGRTDRHGRLLWSLPKGHIEAGETAEQAAVREVEEETGIAGDDRRRARHHRLLVRRRGPPHPQDRAALPDARDRRRAVRRRRRGHRGRLGAAPRDRARSWPTPTSAACSTPRAGCSRRPREPRHAQGTVLGHSRRARGARAAGRRAAVWSAPVRPRRGSAPTRTRRDDDASSTSRRTRRRSRTKPKPLTFTLAAGQHTRPDAVERRGLGVARRPDRRRRPLSTPRSRTPEPPSPTCVVAAAPRPLTVNLAARTARGTPRRPRAPTTRPPCRARRRLPVREPDLPVLVHRAATPPAAHGRRPRRPSSRRSPTQPGQGHGELGLAAARPAAPAAAGRTSSSTTRWPTEVAAGGRLDRAAAGGRAGRPRNVPDDARDRPGPDRRARRDGQRALPGQHAAAASTAGTGADAAAAWLARLRARPDRAPARPARVHPVRRSRRRFADARRDELGGRRSTRRAAGAGHARSRRPHPAERPRLAGRTQPEPGHPRRPRRSRAPTP